jgi:deoxyribose-phosphate aldolase
MPLRPDELAKTIDHTLLDPRAASAEVERVCEEACGHHFATVCVLPRHVRAARRRLGRGDVKVAALIGPDAALAGECVAAGAAELDVALNTGAMVAGDFRRARDELAAVMRAVQMRSVTAGKGQVLVKVGIDCDRLDDKRKRLACMIVEQVDADFAAARARNGGSAVYEVELLRDRLPEAIGVKAFGTVATADDVRELVTAGADRIGTTHALAIMGGAA